MKNKKPLNELPNPLLIIIVVVVIAAALLLAPAAKPAACSTEHPELCNRSCSEDLDCYPACERGCGCLSSGEQCLGDHECFVAPFSCKCVNNKCEIVEYEKVTITTDNAEYAQGEAVKITARNGLDTPVFYYGTERFWGIERFENNAWINVSGFQLTSLEGGKEVCYIKFYERMEPSELKSDSEISHEWSQKICPFDVEEQVPFEPELIGEGRYRLIFSYGLGKSSEDPYELDNPKAVYGNEFTIKGSGAKNCDDYKRSMTEEEIAQCTCPAGYEKFNRLMGAYCATDSQTPCTAHADCPATERCISRDGTTWFCTGTGGGCYYNDPQNPTVEICVD